jgi:adenosylcobinamide-GDP ribazoletransferase
MKYVLLAFSFLTVLPVKLKEAPAQGDLGRAAGWFPWIGILIGGVSALAAWGLRMVFPSLLAAVLTAAVWIGLSGGLHLDGLADCFDGLLNASTPARRLEILKDPRLGTFGGIGLLLAIILKVTAIQALPTSSLWLVLPLAGALGRWLLLPAGKQPLARPGGMGADFAAGLRPAAFLSAAIPLIGLVIWGGWKAFAAVLACHLAAWGIFLFSKNRLGGVTGDVFGLTVEAAEILTLLTFCVQ